MKLYKYFIFIGIIFILIGCETKGNLKSQESNAIIKVQVNENKSAGKELESTEHKPSENSKSSGSEDISASVPAPQVKNTDAEPNRKVVVIDPGHGSRSNLEKEPNAPESNVMKIKDGGGATGISSRIPEYVINMEVAVRLKTLLEQMNYKVVMTKTEHSQSLGNVERAKIGNEAKADLVIRIHCDSNDNSSAAGASMLVPQPVNGNTKKIYEESKRCGEIVLNTLSEQVGIKNRGLIYSKDMTGFNWSEVPVILVEMGFLSNPQEDKLLTDSKYQDKLAKGLAEGIAKALK